MTFDDVIALMSRVANIPPDLLAEVSDDEDECATWLVDKLIQVQQCYIPRFLRDIEQLTKLLVDIDEHLGEVQHEPDSMCWAKRAVLVQALKIMDDRLEAAYALQFAIRSYLTGEEAN